MHKHLQKSGSWCLKKFFLLQLEFKLIKKARRPYNLHTQFHGPGLATTTRHIVLDREKSVFDKMLIEKVIFAKQKEEKTEQVLVLTLHLPTLPKN